MKKSIFSFSFLLHFLVLILLVVSIRSQSVPSHFETTPNADVIPFNETEGGYYQSYHIMIMAIDLGDANVTFSFNLIVKNKIPIKNKLLSDQFSSFNPQVQVDSEITFSEDTFFDENNDTLTYEARLVSDDNGWLPGRRLYQAAEIDDTDLLPTWIIFDENLRKFSLSPTSDYFLHTYTIKVICRNSILEVSDTFSFVVGMSAIYSFNIFLIVIGAFGSALGFFAYRKVFYSILAKRYYCYPVFEKVCIGQEIQMIIFLIKDDLEICNLVWKQIKKNHKDITTMFNSSKQEKTLKDYIDEAGNQLKSQKVFEDYVKFDDLRLVVIFELFLVLETVENYQLTKKIFNQVKNLLQKRKLMLW